MDQTCRFDGSPAVVHVLLDKGCVCFPSDRDQWLCAHHWYKSTPLGSFEIAPDSPSMSLRGEQA